MRKTFPSPISVALALVVFAAANAFASGDPEPPGVPRPLLEGDWYVLVHYRDLAGADPEQMLWDDEVWRFAKHPNGLRWTLHPHVTLRDPTGRGETGASGRETRSTGAWTPNERQLEEIRTGIVPDPHELRAKVLRGSTSAGYRSGGAVRTASASAVGYGEQWSIAVVGDAPEFERIERLDAARAEGAIGRTRFLTRRVEASGDELTGEFSRDGEWVGEFRMIRIRLAPGGRE